jgi:DNA invertase Pin-like site-specific DNA recombinase
MTVYGYARGHAPDAVVHQTGILRAQGCDEVVTDIGSSRDLREGWSRLVEAVLPGDTIRVVSWSVISGNPAAYRVTVYALVDRGIAVEALDGAPPF